jgi:phenylacetate-CoA ligase
MHRIIAKYLVYYPVQYFRGQHVWNYLSDVQRVQYLPAEDIRKIRDMKIRNIVQHASRNVPYYMKCFKAHGIFPDKIRGLDDLVHIPILTKRTVLENEEDLIDKNHQKKLYTRKTSGSTGMTLHFKKEGNALALNDAIMYRCYSWNGIGIGDKQARFWGVPVRPILNVKEQLKDLVLNRIRISAFEISVSSCIDQYRRIQRFKPAYFYGYTTAIYGFCLFAQKMGLDLNGLGLKAVICTAEKMYPHHRELFSQAFQCPVIDEYGSSENGIIAFQCREGNMHMMADHLGIEFLDENNDRVKPGELGKIVITDLGTYGMPLIRYEIGDMGRYSEETCTCGVNLPLMDIVEGRKEDFIRTQDGKLVHAAYLCYTLKDDAVQEFKMYQKGLDRFLVQIVRSPSFDKDTERRLENNLRSALGNEVVISFEYPERIPREASGKLRYFVSEMS